MPTRLSIEQEEQRRWTLRSEYAHVTTFDALVANEFLSADEHLVRQRRDLSRIVGFAATRVPYYRDLFRRLGLTHRDIRGPGDLPLLPVLTKSLIQEDEARFKPPELPWGEHPGIPTVSSGSTGPPARVAHTRRSRLMFGFLKQRELRWCRFDPAGTFAHVRNEALPRGPDGKPIADGETGRAPAWSLVGTYFETGPFIGLRRTTPLDQIVQWLERERPDYLLARPSVLEHLAFAFQDRPPPERLRGLQGTGEAMTPGMRRRIEKTFGVPLHQNYGLNEIGLIASMCLEDGRYHVHTEHCLIEIVDEDGNPCAPGETGRVLVTPLTNDAMPLIRYDTDDVAEVAGGPCPCGRTLPTFGAVVGRYSRIAAVPQDIRDLVNALRGAMERLPAELSKNLREYQVHRRRDGNFELRLVTADTPTAEFAEHLQTVWRAAVQSRPLALRIVEVDHIPAPRGRKYLYFTSDFVSSPAPATATDPAAVQGES